MNNVYIRINEREEVTQFLALVRMMNSANRSINNCHLLEIDYIYQFEDVQLFNDKSCSSRDIILSVITRYQAHKAIRAVSLDCEKRFIFEYEGATITVDYNMCLYFDVLFMCCLYAIACCNVVTTPIKLMIDVMTKKYDLKYDYEQFVNKNREILTLLRVSRSFPSVTINACKAILPINSNEVLSHFPDLPTVLLNPLIFEIIPKLDNTPIELFVYLLIMSREYWSKRYKMSLHSYKNIIECACTDNKFPEVFKIKLLQKWHILDGNNKYNQDLIDYCAEAKKLINKLKKVDKDINTIDN